MERNFSSTEKDTERQQDLVRIFGEGATRLVAQISHDNPELSESEAIGYAWSLIPEATAFMLPAHPDDLTENAIAIHEGYEAERRVKEV